LGALGGAGSYDTPKRENGEIREKTQERIDIENLDWGLVTRTKEKGATSLARGRGKKSGNTATGEKKYGHP